MEIYNPIERICHCQKLTDDDLAQFILMGDKRFELLLEEREFCIRELGLEIEKLQKR